MSREQRRAAERARDAMARLRRRSTTLKRRPGYLSPEGRKHPAEYTAQELRQFLLHDAIDRHPTDLAWATVAYDRIGKLEHIGAERAFLQVRDEVMGLGFRGMPTEHAPF